MRAAVPAVVAVAATLLVGSCSRSASEAHTAPSTSRASSTTSSSSTTTTAGPTQLDTEQLLDMARGAVVRVRNTGCGELSVGSAWLASDGRLVSNRHVVEGLRFLEASTWDGHDLTVTGADVADQADISRIDGDWSAGDEWTPLYPRASRVEPGERIALLGYPEGDELSVSTGLAVGYETDPDLAPREILKLTTVVKPGNSGGPALDMQGRVVGVVYAKELATSESLVIPIADVLGGAAVPTRPAPACDG